MTTATKQKLNKEIKFLITRALNEILSDSDLGLELSGKTKKRLHQASVSRQKTVSFSEIKKKYC